MKRHPKRYWKVLVKNFLMEHEEAFVLFVCDSNSLQSKNAIHLKGKIDNQGITAKIKPGKTNVKIYKYIAFPIHSLNKTNTQN